jgi:putative ABC transport system substrate-binding protein
LSGPPAALVAKATTTKIPIIFNVGVDPVAAGLVACLNRPGGNVTGVSNLSGAAMAKRLELFHELVPAAAVIALLVNPTNPRLNEVETKEVRNAARLLGLQVHIVDAGTAQEIDAAFPLLIERRVGISAKHRCVLGEPTRSNRGAGCTPCGSSNVSIERDRQSRRLGQLRIR